jgi:hypothetical protein
MMMMMMMMMMLLLLSPSVGRFFANYIWGGNDGQKLVTNNKSVRGLSRSCTDFSVTS